MDKYLEKLSEDLENFNLPVDFETAYKKITCPLNVGGIIFWYYKEDEELYEAEGESPHNYPYDMFSGIVVPRHGIELNGGELEIDDAVIVIISSPEEKSYPECYWIALKRLLDDDELVEIFQPQL